MSRRISTTGIGIAYATATVCVTALIILFIGEPDLHDAILRLLLKETP